MTGTIARLLIDKGFGFIRDESGVEHFFHRSSVRRGAVFELLREGQRVLISAHGNSLRALVKHLSNIPDDEITGLEIPTGQPIVYELDAGLNATDRYYLNER